MGSCSTGWRSRERAAEHLEPHRVVAYLDDLQEKTNSLKALQAETSAELDALMPSILDKAFRGELQHVLS